MDKFYKDIEISLDDNAHKRGWKAQNICWAVLILILLLSVLGLAGDGWLSDKKLVSSTGKLTIEFERYLRFKKVAKINLSVKNTTDSIIAITVNKSFITINPLESITPQPYLSVNAHDNIIFYFRVKPSTENQDFLFRITPEQIGNNDVIISLNQNDVLQFNEFIYP